jgi:hypothetical protein
MTESELLASPRDTGSAVELSQRVYRKRILPKATINYRGRKITFDDQYLNDLATSYKDGAYDQVAFMLADSQNTHTLDPERFRGEIKDVEVGDDGLYGIFAVTPQMAMALEENPKLGVSARILENYERSDGKHFPRALQHVLGTLDPVIPGLGSWEEVALSNPVAGGTVLDLSATSYEELEHMADRAELLKQVAEATDMTESDLEALDMTDDELEIFASAFGPAADAVEGADEELVEEPGQDELDLEAGPTDADIQAAVEALTDEELAELAAELGVEDEADTETDDEDEPEDEPEDDTEDEPEAEVEEPETEEVTEPTDAELVDRLGSGEFGSGIDEPVVDDVQLDGLSDEELAEMTDLWATAVERDAAGHEMHAEAEAAAAQAAEDAAETDIHATAEETADEVTEEPVLAGAVTLSNEAPAEVVALSNQVNVLQQKLARQEFETLRKDYVRKGVPSALVDLARPILTAGSSATLEFSNPTGGTETVDAANIVRQLLDSATGYIDLARERGHSYAPDKDEQAAMESEEDKRLASLWGEQYGI